MDRNKSLKDLLLIHELAFILLILLVATAGAVGIHLWDTSSQESNRISLLVREVQQTRGDLYRQMKELFDAYFLEDTTALVEYNNFTLSVEKHFTQLEHIAVGAEEKSAINSLHSSYRDFVSETSVLFNPPSIDNNNAARNTIKHVLNTGLETGLFTRYERILAHIEKLLNQKQLELDQKLEKTKHQSTILLIIPLMLAVLLLIFSRVFLKRAIVKPIEGVLKATAEISAGHLTHRAPETGAKELAAVSNAINEMADKLVISQEALVRTEKQAAQGLLVPMLAHNIRNPLASIRATAQVINTPEHDQETQESLLGIINTVDRLERWTGALLAYLHPLKPQPVNTTIRQVVEGAIDPLRQKIKEKSITLTLPVWPKSDEVYTDQHLLEQVIYNLLLNAIDALSKAGSIVITVEVSTEEFTLRLSDNGCGMPFTPDPSAANAPTTKRFGTGLGIPFAFKVCDALGGSVQFVAAPAGGTVVTISLPRSLRNL